MTSTKIVHEEINRFLRSADAEVLCITGKWGVGKTFSWKKAVIEAQERQEIGPKTYAYVSLFGVNSLNDLKAAIFENSVPVGKIGIQGSLASEWIDKIRDWRVVIGMAKNAPKAKDYAAITERLLFWFIRKQIVCIDDLERAGNGLNAKDVLGLISFLREERHCKVVLLLNEEELEEDHKADFSAQVEKVIDTKLEFDPTPAEAAAVGINTSTTVHNYLVENCVALGITNIRVIRKIERLAIRLAELLKNFDVQVTKQAVHSVTLFGWSHFQPKNAPPISFITKFEPWGHIVEPKAEATDQEKAWKAVLQSYSFTNVDDLDQVILAGTISGAFDPDALNAAAAPLNTQIERQRQDNSFSEAWHLYHYSFTKDADEVLGAIEAAFHSSVVTISPLNLSGTVRLFKSLGQDQKAAGLLAYYLEQRKDEDKKFFDLSNNPFGAEVTDPDVRAALNAKLATFKLKIDPRAILLKIAKNDGWHTDDINELAKLSADDFVAIFKGIEGPDLPLVIQAALKFGQFGNASPEMIKITESATEALRKIAAESPINASRVGRYGIAASSSGDEKK